VKGFLVLHRGQRLVVAALSLVWLLAPFANGTEAAVVNAAGFKLVFAATGRAIDDPTFLYQALYTADGDGRNVRRITPIGDRIYYDWPMWALHGTKIVYTTRTSLQGGTPEYVWLADPDGSNAVQLTTNPWRNIQPRISPDGEWLLFTSFWDEFPSQGLYRMSLNTGQVENLSAQYWVDGALEADPKWSPDGTQIVFAVTRAIPPAQEQPTQIYSMNADGTARQPITSDTYFNTDPSMSPSGRLVAFSSYRGAGDPTAVKATTKFDIKQRDWRLVVKDITSGKEQELTEGENCSLRAPQDPCSIVQAPAWVPQFSPDGQRIAFLGIRSSFHSGIYSVDPQGRNPHTILEFTDRAIRWYDWSDEGPPPTGVGAGIGKTAPTSSLLYRGRAYLDLPAAAPLPPAEMFVSTLDRWRTLQIQPVGRPDLAPEVARWSPDKRWLVFTARVPIDPTLPAPAPPPGQERHVHFSFADPENPNRPLSWNAEEQVFLMNADGSNVRQLTTPKTEDYMDAIPDDEMRGSTDPDVSPDGRYVVFTNRSGSSNESWIVRKDLRTGEVLNLTSSTIGTTPAGDVRARFSPDGRQIAFVSAVGEATQIFVMAPDGQNVRQVTQDDYVNLDPAWSPDGKWLVYTSYRGPGSPVVEGDAGIALDGTRRVKVRDWNLVKLNLENKQQVTLVSQPDVAAFRPVWSPDGSRIAMIAFGRSKEPDIYVVGTDGRNLRPIAITLKTKELSVDWR
jgi:Tol biopolymer transport system component